MFYLEFNWIYHSWVVPMTSLRNVSNVEESQLLPWMCTKIHGLKRHGIIFVMILYMQFYREVGLKWSKEEGEFTFWIIVKNVELKAWEVLHSIFENTTTLRRSLCNMSKNLSKNSISKPPRLGDLLVCIFATSLLSSNSYIGAIKVICSLSLNQFGNVWWDKWTYLYRFSDIYTRYLPHQAYKKMIYEHT